MSTFRRLTGLWHIAPASRREVPHITADVKAASFGSSVRRCYVRGYEELFVVVSVPFNLAGIPRDQALRCRCYCAIFSASPRRWQI
jgi:hypothetical protein